jgi:hypothetical protein
MEKLSKLILSVGVEEVVDESWSEVREVGSSR